MQIHQFLIFQAKQYKKLKKQPMILSRTRKQIKNMQSFYKEAGLHQQIENIYQQNLSLRTLAKKDRMLIKKKIKQELVNKEEVKTNTDKILSDVSQENIKESFNLPNISNLSTRSSGESTLSLQRIINKISILQVNQSKTVFGCYGHTTVVFKKPVIEGNYYIQFKVLKPNLNEGKAKIKHPPSIRIGICPIDYPRNTPLGQHLSIGYKASNGKFVYSGVQHEGGEAIYQDDVIGLGLKFSPPHKYQDRNAFWQQSQILITKNGKLIKTFNKIHQTFYCPAFSLFNYGGLEVRYEKNNIQHLIQGFKPYATIFNEDLTYDYLKNTIQFSSPFLGDI